MPDNSLEMIVYSSTARKLLSTYELETQLKQYRYSNQLSGITGILMHLNGSFLQCIEGEKEALSSLYAKIQLDDRHTNVRTLLQAPIKEKLFESWYMGYYEYGESFIKIDESCKTHPLSELDKKVLQHGPVDGSLVSLHKIIDTFLKHA